MTNFFRTKVASFGLKGRNRLVIFVLFVAWLATAGYYTSQLEPVQLSEQDLSKDHPLQRAVNILRENFPTAEQDTAALIHVTWGIANVDRSGVNQLFDPDDLGEAAFDDGFVFNEQCQDMMLTKCDSIKTDERFEQYIKKNDKGQGAVHCFVEEFGAFNALRSLDDCKAVLDGEWKYLDWQVPLDQVNNSTAMAEVLNSNSCYGKRETIQSHYKGSIGFNGTALVYAGLSIEDAVLDPWATYPEDLVREHYDAYIALAQELDADMENVCGTKVMVTDSDQKFIMMNNQKLYRENAIKGALLGVAIAFVLLVSTRRLLVSFFATLSILGF